MYGTLTEDNEKRDFYKDYLSLFLHRNKKQEMEIEDINDILMSSEYYPSYGEYGIERFLNFYESDFLVILEKKRLHKRLNEGLEINKTLTPKRKI